VAKNDLPRILIVEDDTTFRETVLEVLRDVGFKVRGARNLRKATKRLTKHKFDLVLSDLHIGDESGFDVLQLALEKRPEAKLVLMSSKADPEIMEQAKASGASRFLPKPFKVNELLSLIDELLQSVPVTEEADADEPADDHSDSDAGGRVPDPD
jgi:two-component system response regulator PilR (NtrC family)